MPISTAKLRLFSGNYLVRRNAVSYILVKVGNADQVEAAQSDIKALLRDRHSLVADVPDDIMVGSPATAMAAQHESTRILSILLAAIASVSLVVGGISIMNIMLVSITERTREIGLRLAVGARRRDIRRQFLAEAIALCLIGGALGVTLGIAGAVVLSRLAGWPVFVGPGSIAAAVFSATAIGVFFGWYPASKAARLDPIEALRFE